MKKKFGKFNVVLIALAIVAFGGLLAINGNRSFADANGTGSGDDGQNATFESDGGQYSLDYILQNYNVFVSGDYQGTHVIGPVITGGGFSAALGGLLPPSKPDGYPHTVPSYIKGELGSNTLNVYSNVNVYLGSVNKGKTFYLVNGINSQNPDGLKFSDDYVDFDKWDGLKSQAKTISDDPTVRISYKNGVPISSDNDAVKVVKEWPGYVLNVQAGNTVAIESGDLSDIAINVIGSAASSNTVITSDEATVKLPLTLINGVEPNSIEYQSDGVALVYSFPDATSVSGTREITGHIVAPDAAVDLTGGNYNGCIIAKSVRTSAEGHMWPYHGPGLKVEKVTVEGKKIWNDNNNEDKKRPDEIKINLLKRVGDGETTKCDTKIVKEDADGNWTWKFDDLPKYEDGKEIVYSVSEDAVEGYTQSVDGYNVTNTYAPGKTSVKVTKEWDDSNDQDGIRPEKVMVQLYGDDEKIGDEVELNKAGSWSYIWTDLPEKKSGKVIRYSVKEAGNVDGYTSEINDQDQNNIIIKNKHVPERTSVEGIKTWSDNNDQDGKRPDQITIHLLANGTEVGKEEVKSDENGNWKYKFNDLPKYESGQAINYTVTEDAVAGYTFDKGDGKYDIKNSHTPELTEVKGKKTWNDADDRFGSRPEKITVNLLADGREVDEKTVSADSNWEYCFSDIPKYKDGREIQYTVTEDAVSGYSTEINGYDIQNSYTPKETSVTVTKCWNDDNDKDKIRPDSIRVQLYANGNKVGDPVKLNVENKWTYTWNGLPEKKDGKQIEYTVKEAGTIEGYSVSVNAENHGNMIITNSHTPKIKTGPKTGDKQGLTPYVLMMTLSLVAISVMFVKKRKTDKSR